MIVQYFMLVIYIFTSKDRILLETLKFGTHVTKSKQVFELELNKYKLRKQGCVQVYGQSTSWLDTCPTTSKIA